MGFPERTDTKLAIDWRTTAVAVACANWCWGWADGVQRPRVLLLKLGLILGHSGWGYFALGPVGCFGTGPANLGFYT
ncbi:hypothetical protein V6Z11_D10G278300 [Gossypium hirsutum]